MPIIEEICTITAKGQTTVPKAVRQALGVGYGGRIAFWVDDHSVTIHALPEDDRDPALAPFLSLLAADLVTRPGDAIRPISSELVSRMEALADDAGEADPDALIDGDVAL
jgi:antitoxin PrlF